LRNAAAFSICIAIVSVACGALLMPGPRESAPVTGEPNPAASALPAASGVAAGAEFFIAADGTDSNSPSPSTSRSRLVRLNLALLLNAKGQPRRLAPHQEIVLNLFPDVVYTGVIEDVQIQGEAGTWVGTLKGVEYSSVMMVYTSGVFMGHFASPAGIYEVSTAGGDLYRIILIDQGALPGGD
jgi:hypothetical protein